MDVRCLGYLNGIILAILMPLIELNKLIQIYSYEELYSNKCEKLSMDDEGQTTGRSMSLSRDLLQVS